MPIIIKDRYKRKVQPGVSFEKKKKRVHLKNNGEPGERFFLVDVSNSVSEILGVSRMKSEETPQKGVFLKENIQMSQDGNNNPLNPPPTNEADDQQQNDQQQNDQQQNSPANQDAKKDVDNSKGVLKELKKWMKDIFGSDIEDLQERCDLLEDENTSLNTKISSLENENKNLKKQIENMSSEVETKAEEAKNSIDKKIQDSQKSLDEKVQKAENVEININNSFTTTKNEITNQIGNLRAEFGQDLTNIEDNLTEVLASHLVLSQTVNGMSLKWPQVSLEDKKKEAETKIQKGKSNKK